MNKKTVTDIDVKGKRCLVRVDFNVPIDENGKVTDDNRIVGALPTINYLRDHGAKVILCSHLGRPKGTFNLKYSLRPVAVRLAELGVPVVFAEDVIGESAKAAVAAMKDGDVVLLENLRFHIEEEKTYHLTYTLADAFGNTTRLSVWIEGKEQEIPEIETEGTELFHWMADNRFGAKGIRMTIPKGNLYDDLYFRYSVKEDSTALADTHILHNRPVPLHSSARLSLRLRVDTLENKQQYGIIRTQKGRRSWIGGTYRNGWIDGTIKELGNYTVGQDLKAPTITPLGANTWISKQAFVFRLSDNLSGVQTYRGEIDGQYVLFEMNSKSVITYKFDKERLEKGKHTLKLTVTDAAGNRSEYKYSFVW